MKNATGTKIYFGIFCPYWGFRQLFYVAESLNVDFLRKKHERFGTFFLGFVMSLKKFLKRNSWTMRGQSTVEYFILLVALAVLTIVGSSTFFAKMQRSSGHVLNYSVGQMKQDNLATFSLGGVTPGGWTNTTI
ncbi:MAG: hypothetical protein PHH75_00725 [Candidatus Omnitrophica bacterium]|nr:hypothetical protein [Candidatus Omnitrophota bacterium]MDD5573688.1 hypothetical protein [Candidatus Omnitrophota bacterium]